MIRPLTTILCVLLPALALTAQEALPIGSDPFRVAREMPVRAAVRDGICLIVVDEQGDPVTGASVLVLHANAMGTEAGRQIATHPDLMLFGSDAVGRMLAIAAALGERYVTGEDGRAEVAVDGSAQAFIVHRRTVQPTLLRAAAVDGEHRVALQSVPAIEVLCRDAAGRPAAGVRLFVLDRGMHVRNDREVLAETDSHGRAWVGLPPDGDALHVVAAVIAREPVLAPIDRETSRIVLDLPPCGSLRVDLTEAPQTLRRSLRVTLAPDVLAQWPRLYAVRPTGVAGDFVDFDWVPVDEPLEVDLMSFRPRVRTSIDMTGPALPDEMKVVRVEAEALPLEVRRRVLASDGEPLVREPLLVVVDDGDSAFATLERTDSSGVLVAWIPPESRGVGGQVTLVRRGDAGQPSGAQRWSIAEVVEGGERALVDVRLAEEPILLAGRVVDDAGRPLRGIQVSTEVAYGAASGGVQSTVRQLPARWSKHSATTDADGRFVLRGMDRSRRSVEIELSIDPSMRLVGPRELPPGTTDAELVVAMSAALEGAFVPFPAGPPPFVWCDLVAEDGGVTRLPLADDGRFDAHGLPPGEFAFEVNALWAQEPLHLVEGVELVTGETCHDSRLASIDWRAFMRPITVTLTSAPTVAFVVRMSDRPELGRTGIPLHGPPSGPYTLWAGDDGATIGCFGPEVRPQMFAGLKRDTSIALVARPRIRVVLKNLPDLPQWLELRSRTDPATPEPALMMNYDDHTFVAEDGSSELRPQKPGAARITLEPQIGREVAARLEDRDLRIETTPITRDIQVEDGAGVQEILVELTDDEAASLIELVGLVEATLGK